MLTYRQWDFRRDILEQFQWYLIISTTFWSWHAFMFVKQIWNHTAGAIYWDYCIYVKKLYVVLDMPFLMDMQDVTRITYAKCDRGFNRVTTDFTISVRDKWGPSWEYMIARVTMKQPWRIEVNTTHWSLTHWGREWTPFHRRYFQMHFLEWKCFSCD